MEDIEKLIGTNVTLYGHSITRAHAANRPSKVTIVPAAAPLAWVPAQGTEQEDDKFNFHGLGQWIPSREEVSGVHTCKMTGLVRPVFEVTAIPKPPETNAWNIQPTSGAGKNPLHILTIKRLSLKAGHFMAF